MSSLLTLSIHQMAPGRFLARVTQGDVEVTEPTHHESVESAILELGRSSASDEARGFHVWYGGVYAGTIPMDLLEAGASELGHFLSALSLVFCVHPDTACN